MPFRRPEFQTVCVLQHTRPWRIASAILAADSDATVVCRLGTEDMVRARRLGLRVLDHDEDPHDVLVTTGLALIDASATTTAAWPPSEADCLVREFTRANRTVAPMAYDETLPARTLWVSDRGCWRTAEGVTRRLRVPGAPPRVERSEADLGKLLLGADAPLAERVAWEAATLLWLSGWLPRFADVLEWTRTRLRRGVNLRVYR